MIYQKFLFGKSRPVDLGLITSILVIGIYNLFFLDNYYPITEGWFSTYSKLMLNGLMPYKDFYLFITPLYPLLLSYFQSIFGDTFIALRMLGLVVMLIMALVLYRILRSKFSEYSSTAGTILSIIYYQSGVAHITYDFTQFFSLFILLYLYCLLGFSKNQVTSYPKIFTEANVYLISAGIFCSCAFLIKQSNGGIMVFTSFFTCFVVFQSYKFKKIFFNFLMYCIGLLTPIFFIALWLYKNESVDQAISQILFSAISAKGGLKGILFGWFYIFNIEFFIKIQYILISFIPLLLLVYYDGLIAKNIRSTNLCFRENLNMLLIGSVSFLLIWLAYVGLNFYDLKAYYDQIGIYQAFAIAFAILSISIFWLNLFLPSQYRNLFLSEKNSKVFFIVSTFLLFANGTSGGISEISCFLPIAFTIAFLLEYVATHAASKIYATVVILFLIFLLASFKFYEPYKWWYTTSGVNISKNLSHSNFKNLAGIKMLNDTATILDSIERAVANHSIRGNDIFIFPNISGLYALLDRLPHSKVIVPWFDFLPDDLAIAESKRLLNSPPQILINLTLPEEAWAAHEKFFRNGHPLGQRSMLRAIEILTTSEGLYSSAFVANLSDETKIEVWYLNNDSK